MNLKIQNKPNYKKCFDNVLILSLIFINNINNFINIIFIKKIIIYFIIKMNKSEENPLTKFIYILLLYSFFIFSGLFEEKIFKQEYEYINEKNEIKKIKFKNANISLFIISFFSIIVSNIGLLYSSSEFKGEKNVKIFSNSDKTILGIFYVISKYSADSSLQFVDFIIKVIGKSCKSASILIISLFNNVPIIGALFKKLINFKDDKKNIANYTFNDIIKVILNTLSVILFTFGSNEGNKGKNIQKNNSEKIIGIVLLLISLLSDGLLALKEKILNNNIENDEKLKKYKKLLSWEYMSLFSIITLFFCTISIIYGIIFNDLFNFIKIIFNCKILLRDLFFYGILVSFGQCIIFLFLEKYGPLTLSMLTSIRKVLTITLSIIVFGKNITFIQFISLIMAIIIIFWEVFEKRTKTVNVNKINKSA